MCSILGMISPGQIPDELIKQAPALLGVTRHRGPDDQGSVVINERVYLGNNRLSIIDPSFKGKMPMKSSNGSVWITYNGEVYNYVSLREELMGKGYTFKSTSDSEVVLNAYIHWGDAFVDKLNGIFAFLIFDQRRNRVITGRDRFGGKPLYYCQIDGCLIFSSDYIVLRDLLYPKSESVDRSALTAYMQCRFVPGERTILKDIFKLRPAEVRTWQLKGLSSKSRIFWSPRFKSEPFDQDVFNEKLDQAIRYTKTADLTPSLLLSGGLDSAAVAAILHDQGSKEVNTLTCVYTDADDSRESEKPSYQITTPNLDESMHAKCVAGEFNFKNEVFSVDSNINLEIFLEMQKALGEPIASTNALGHYLFAKALKGRTKLAVAGTGSDELLGGYQELYFKGGEEKLQTKKDPYTFLNAFADFDSGEISPLKYLNSELIQPDYLTNLTVDAMEQFPTDKYRNELLNQLAFFEIAFALPGWELDQADRLFMSQSIELRPAFLENDFVDYALTIPSRVKLGKEPLKRAMSNYLPRSIINRPKYPGLGTPKKVCGHEWFKSAIRNLFEEPLDIWNRDMLDSLVSQQAEKWNFDVLYRLVYLQLWLK